MAAAAVESYHMEKGSINIPLSEWPKVVDIDKTAVADTIAVGIVDKLNTGLANEDYDEVVKLFLKDGHWRDHLASSMDFRTLKGRDSIIAFIKANPFVKRITIERDTTFRMPHFGPLDLVGDPKGITFHVSFIATHGSGRGVIRLADEGQGWGIFTVFLSLQSIGDILEPLGGRRPNGHYNDAKANTKNWADRRKEDFEFNDRDPTVFIVGAGQAGLMASARLKMLGVDTLCIDTNSRIGDNWRRRYHSLVLHDPVHFDQMPYMPFPAFWPTYIPKDKLADWFESYAKNLELNIWTKTKLISSSWDDQQFQWTVEVERARANGKVEKRTFKPKHVIQCTGHSGKKSMPDIKGMDSFKGDRLCHSSEYVGLEEDRSGQGKKAIVVGACNSGHDIARDYHEHGYEVTMVQRSSTCVVSSSSIKDIGLAGLYDETSPDVEDADLWLWGMPPELFKSQQKLVAGFQREADKETIEGLEKAGFKCDDGPDDSGLFIKYLQRGGGYYIDVGASKMIAEGQIKVKHGQQIEEVLEHGLKFADGSTLEADEIVFATGYQNMRTQAQITFGDDVYNRVSDVWGFDKEGEFRGIYRRSGHPGFWFFGGNFPLCRYYSRLLALQIKALEMGYASREPGNVKIGKASQDFLVLNDPKENSS